MSKASKQRDNPAISITMNWMQMKTLSQTWSVNIGGKRHIVMDFLNSPADIKDGTDDQTHTIIWTMMSGSRYAAVPVDALKTMMKNSGEDVKEQVARVLDDCKRSPQIKTQPQALEL